MFSVLIESMQSLGLFQVKGLGLVVKPYPPDMCMYFIFISSMRSLGLSWICYSLNDLGMLHRADVSLSAETNVRGCLSILTSRFLL